MARKGMERQDKMHKRSDGQTVKQRTDSSWSKLKAIEHLSKADNRLAEIISSVGACDIKLRSDPFRSLVESIVFQQLSGSAAEAILSRFIALYGKFPSPGQILSTEDSRMKQVGLSSKKVEYIKSLCSRIVDKELDLGQLRNMEDEQVIGQLIELNGIGRWTAEMFLIFHLGRPDVLPLSDLGLRKAIQRVYSFPEPPPPAVMMGLAEPWRPFRSVATWYLWKSLSQFKGIG
jgi:DNA-3-methyladenine glycosylase II